MRPGLPVPTEFVVIDPTTGEPYDLLTDEELAGILHVRKAHYPDLSGVAPAPLADELLASLRVPRTIRPLQGLRPNQRGASVELNPGDPEKEILCCRGLGEDSETITVCFSFFVEATGLIDAGETFLRGSLQWGIGGAQHVAQLDIMRGTIITVPANFLRAGASFAPPIGSIGVPLPHRVNCSYAYGTVAMGASCPARFTDRLGIIGPGGTTVSTIPPFAVGFTVLSGGGFGSGLTFQPADLTVDAGAGSPPAVGNLFQLISPTNVGIQSEWQFPLFNSARRVFVTNTGVAPAFYQVIYALAL